MSDDVNSLSLFVAKVLLKYSVARNDVELIYITACFKSSSFYIHISDGPHIQASGITMTTLGDSVTLECKVEAQPEPKMIFWRSHEDRTPVIQGGKYDITTRPVRDEEDKYIMQLTIKQITDMDVGKFSSRLKFFTSFHVINFYNSFLFKTLSPNT